MAETPQEVQLTPQQINRLKSQAQQAIDMRADIKVVVSVIKSALKAFGMNEMKMQEGASIQSIMPEIIRKLTLDFASGSFDTQALANIQEIMPIIEKYKYLSDDQ